MVDESEPNEIDAGEERPSAVLDDSSLPPLASRRLLRAIPWPRFARLEVNGKLKIDFSFNLKRLDK